MTRRPNNLTSRQSAKQIKSWLTAYFVEDEEIDRGFRCKLKSLQRCFSDSNKNRSAQGWEVKEEEEERPATL